MVSKSHKELDMFKINLLNSMNKNGFLKMNKMLLFVLLLLAVIAFIPLITSKLIIK